MPIARMVGRDAKPACAPGAMLTRTAARISRVVGKKLIAAVRVGMLTRCADAPRRALHAT